MGTNRKEGGKREVKEIKKLENKMINKSLEILEKNGISQTEEKIISDTIQLIQITGALRVAYPKRFEDDE